jgi:hypothetical protein
LLDQLAHRRQVTVTCESQPMGEPAVLDQEAHQVFRTGPVPAGLDHDAALE